MNLTINIHVLKRVVSTMPDNFATKDVSEHADMALAHPAEHNERNWHQMVGKALSEYRTALSIDETQKGTSRGSRWCRKTPRIAPHVENRVSETPPPVVPARAQESIGAAADLGPQYHGDNRLAARLRRHQSWYRANVLALPCGVGPTANSASLYGNMLTSADGQRGANFLTPAIHAMAKQRIAQNIGTVEPFRLMHNMLSSQPMCFNLFGPLVNDLELATRLMAALLPGQVAQVSEVKIEFAPTPALAYLGDKTAFDAYVAWRRPDGGLEFMGFETKLSEPFSQQVYDSPLYRRWMTEDSPWVPHAMNRVADQRHNQLWRDHMLAVAHRQQPGARWQRGRLALVRHPEDSDCARIAGGYRELLRQGDDTFVEFTLEQVVDAWAGVARGEAESEWLRAFRLRYLDLGMSRA